MGKWVGGGLAWDGGRRGRRRSPPARWCAGVMPLAGAPLGEYAADGAQGGALGWCTGVVHWGGALWCTGVVRWVLKTPRHPSSTPRRQGFDAAASSKLLPRICSVQAASSNLLRPSCFLESACASSKLSELRAKAALTSALGAVGPGAADVPARRSSLVPSPSQATHGPARRRLGAGRVGHPAGAARAR